MHTTTQLTLGDDIEAKEQLDNRTWGATKENWRMQNGPFQKMTARDTELTEYLVREIVICAVCMNLKKWIWSVSVIHKAI